MSILIWDSVRTGTINGYRGTRKSPGLTKRPCGVEAYVHGGVSGFGMDFPQSEGGDEKIGG